MNKDLIKAYLWETIINLAFSPSTHKDQDTWLSCYSTSLPSFWGIDDYPHRNGRRVTFENKLIDITYECLIENCKKGVVEIFLKSSGNLNLMWNHDIDPKYFQFPNGKVLPKKLPRCSNYLQVVDEEMQSILDGLIFHPAVHQHIDLHIPDIESNDCTHTSNHDVRIGGGISNPFLFLFQLRYQFCVKKQNRNKEQKRLVELFSSEIKNKKMSISAGKLFDIAR